jgi:predicted transcriptional regulator
MSVATEPNKNSSEKAISSAAADMVNHENSDYPCLPVIDADTKAVGILYARDALEALLTETQDQESLLRDYVMCVGYH